MKESFEWVLSCVNSCTNFFQLDSAKVLVQLFKMMYKEEKKLSMDLDTAVLDKQTFLSYDA